MHAVITAAGMDAVVHQNTTVGLQGHSPDQSVQFAAIPVIGSRFGAFAKPQCVVQLQQDLIAETNVAGIGIHQGAAVIDVSGQRSLLCDPTGGTGSIRRAGLGDLVLWRVVSQGSLPLLRR